MPFPRFLVISIGNQAPYLESLHSAGHAALSAVQKYLHPAQPPFTRERYGKRQCMASSSQLFTFLQSPTMMNNCGPWVGTAWREMLQAHNLEPSQLGLVIIHDELEAAFGRVRTVNWEASPRGHNGLKSIKKCLDGPKQPLDRWKRIAVGIGRPEERTPDVVSKYVLSNMTPSQKSKIDREVAPQVASALQQLHDAWVENSESI
ncbi:peptidyl-tRNA hydrolase [Xylariaceae sp. FL0594]|nr:peptidyl-tRNA hydrolase [Xylariaceae sp. FL0594]